MTCPACGAQLVPVRGHWDCPECRSTILGCCEGAPLDAASPAPDFDDPPRPEGNPGPIQAPPARPERSPDRADEDDDGIDPDPLDDYHDEEDEGPDVDH